MSAGYYTGIAVIMILVSGYFTYQYLTHRQEGKVDRKHFFRMEKQTWPACTAAVAAVLAIAVYCYGFYVRDSRFIRSIMNAEVLIWLAILAYVDLKEKVIPNHMIGLGLGTWVLLVLLDLLVGKTPFRAVMFYSLSGGVLLGGVLLIISLISKSALGMGDVKMFFVLGLLYGVMDAYSILLYSIFIMALACIVLLIAKKANRKTAVPMAPFVVLGFIVSILLGM